MNPRPVALRWSDPDGPDRIDDLLAGLERLPAPALLESASFDDRWGRFSLILCRPVRTLTVRDGLLLRDGQPRLATAQDDVWPRLGEELDAFRLDPAHRQPCPLEHCPYLPGWVGFIGYEIGRLIEDLPARASRDTDLPDLHLGFYDAVAVFDHARRRWAMGELRFEDSPSGTGESAGLLRDLLAGASPSVFSPTQPVRITPSWNFAPEDYRRAVQCCIDHIAAGDLFQVNLSQRFCLSDAPEPMALYRRLRGRNPACYAAYLPVETPGGRSTLISSSPELFLRCRGRDVLTRPIKGTRPRGRCAAEDALIAEALAASAKDNAELAMIIDLLRNDLGRVCAFGSVRVERRRVLEAHPTVFHLVGEVVGRLRPDVRHADLLRATLPGGSITGAPKIRAMELIDELEHHARGAYTGCIGWVGADGSAEWNLAIRTIVHDAGRALGQVGGGIVADSTPQGEYRETLDKARAMLDALAEAVGDEPTYQEPIPSRPDRRRQTPGG